MSVALTLGALALLVGASRTLGRLALYSLPSPELRQYERISLELTAGLGLSALMLSFAALAGLLVVGMVSLVVVAALGAALSDLRPHRLPPSPSAGTEVFPGRRAGLLLVGCICVACIGAIAPVTDEDALAYVVPIARHIAQSGRLGVWSDQARSMWPLSHEVLIAAVMTVGGDRFGAVSALEWLLAIGAISALARRVCEQAANVPAAIALAIGSPVVAFLVGAAKEDLLLVAATAGAAFCLTGSGTIAEAAAAGLFAGIAAGAKYPGVGVAVAVVAWSFTRDRDPLRRGAITTVCAVAVGGLWYGLNLLRFGNPVAPLVWGARGTPIDATTAREFVDAFGAGRSPLSFFITPVRLFVDSGLYCGRAALFNPLTYVGFAALWSTPARRRHAAPLFIAAVLYIGWFLTMHNARLLLPASVLIAPSAADRLMAVAARGRGWRMLVVSTLAVPLVFPPAVGAIRASRLMWYGSAFLDRESQHYADIRWANAHLDWGHHRIASFYRPIGYFDIPVIYLERTHQFEISGAELDDPLRLLEACRRQRITHLFAPADVDPSLARLLRRVYANPASRLGGVRFIRDAPTESTAIFEIIP